jgi:hypothetical protein
MSVIILTVLVALGSFGAYDWLISLVRQIKAKSGPGVVVSCLIAVGSLVLACLAAGDVWSASGLFVVFLAAIHQTWSKVSGWIKSAVAWIRRRGSFRK